MEYNGKKYYVAGNGYYMDSKGKYLHHEILPKKEGYVVDHINGNKLDNSPNNLRYATRQQNCFNSIPTNSTGVKGVYVDKNRKLKKPYRVMLNINGKQKHFGRYKSLEEAKDIANKKILEYHKEFAVINR